MHSIPADHSAAPAAGAAPDLTERPFTLILGSTLRLVTADGAAVQLGGQRERSVLALLALGEGHVQPRRLMASLMWSHLELRQALARLRDVLHDLRGKLQRQGCDIIGADATSAWLLAQAVEVRPPPPGQPMPLLPELLGLDPQLDQWLSRPPGLAQQPRPDRGARPAAPMMETVAAESEAPAQPIAIRLLLAPVSAAAGAEASLTAEAITDALITALTRVRSLSIAMEAATAGGGPSHYRLSGQLHVLDGRPRLALRLVQLASGQIVWAEVFHQDVQGPGDFATDVAALTSACLEQQLLLLEAERASRGGPLTSPREMMLAAILDLYRLQRESFTRAGRLLTAAVRAAPEMAAAHGWLAYWYILAVGQGWAENERAALLAASEAAERAVLLDPRDARGLAVSGHVRAFLHREVPEAVALCRRALDLNPNLPAVQTFAGMAHAYAGELEVARAHLKRALWLQPRDPHVFFTEAGLASVEMLRGEHAQAVEIARAALQLQPRFTAAMRAQIAALGHLGRIEEARPLIRSLLSLDPRFTLARFRAAIPYRKREHLAHFVRGLRLAGLE